MFKPALSRKTDEQLMQLLAEGNSHALTELYKRYSPKLIRYFFRMLWKDEAKAQDFLHDLFLKILTNPRYFDQTKKFSTWIYSVAHNMCKNEYRKQAFRNSLMEDEIVSMNELMMDPTTESGDIKELIDMAVNHLEEDDRNLYTLRYEVELSLEEISTMLDCPTGTVKSRLFYLKKKLAVHLSTGDYEKIQYGIQ
jgi:RNA polymerase sigma-70 factor, ECF subfamily